MNKLDPMGIYRTLCTQTVKETFFSSTHRLFQKIDHIMDPKEVLTNFKGVKSHTVY